MPLSKRYHLKKMAICFIVCLNFAIFIFGFTGVGAYTYTGSCLGNVAGPFGRGYCRGYFTDANQSLAEGEGHVLPTTTKGSIIRGGSGAVAGEDNAIPKVIDTPSELVSFLKANYAESWVGKQYSTTVGAAFIYNTMMGNTAPGTGVLGDKASNYSKKITDSDWSNLLDRLVRLNNAGLIDWAAEYGGSNIIMSFLQRGGEDDTYFQKFSVVQQPAIQFYSSVNGAKTIAYTLMRSCANPAGNLSGGLPEPPQNWTISASSSSDKSNAAPGDNITWTHVLVNSGPGATTSSINSSLGFVGFSGDGQVSSTGSGVVSGSEVRRIESKYTVTDNDLGKNLCESVKFSPKSSTDSGEGSSTEKCVFVPYEYSLLPYVSANPNGAIEAGTVLSVSPTVNNTGPTSSQKTTWKLTRTITPGLSKNVSTGSDIVFSKGDTSLQDYIDTDTDYNTGTKICYVLSLTPVSNSNPDTVSSSSTCVTIGKKPKVQIWGGDLFTKGYAKTSTSIKSGSTFGSWIEYGIFAAGRVSGLASGAAYGLSGAPSANFCDASKLSFTNVNCSSGSTGEYISQRSLVDVASSFPASAGVSVPVTGNNIGSLTMHKGQWAVVNASGDTIKITGDINYDDGPFDSINDIPQLIIIAKNIEISKDVKNIDAWLIARDGYINTCNEVAIDSGLSSNICSNPLKINGPVVSDKIYLRRTYGSEKDNVGEPAETFNLRADSYLWAAVHAALGDNRVQTIYSTELPPRF